MFDVERAVILGAGASSSTPKLQCALSKEPCAACKDASLRGHESRNHRLNPSFLIQLRRRIHPDSGTAVTADAQHHNKHNSNSNKRHAPVNEENSSSSSSSTLNVLIDCGKTFRETALKLFRGLGVHTLDTVLLTHEHADATLGLDDLREFSTHKNPIVVYTDAATQATLRGVFGYLFPTHTQKGLWVASIEWELFYNNDNEATGGVDVSSGEVTTMANTTREQQSRSCCCEQQKQIPTTSPISKALDQKDSTSKATAACSAASRLEHRVVPVRIGQESQRWDIGVLQVWHGVDTRCNAFVFPLDVVNGVLHVCVYMSDVSEVNAETIKTLRLLIEELETKSTAERMSCESGRTVDDDIAYLHAHVRVVVLDMLAHQAYISHIGMDQAVEAAKKMCNSDTGAKAFFVGMSHTLEYNETNTRLQEIHGVSFPAMQVGWDGCVVYEKGGVASPDSQTGSNLQKNM